MGVQSPSVVVERAARHTAKVKLRLGKLMGKNPNAAGLAALSICESLLLSLTDLDIIKGSEAISILKDAAAAHRGAITNSNDPAVHQAAAEVIDRIIKGKNSVRHA